MTYGRENCKYLIFIGADFIGDLLVMLQKCMKRMKHDDPWLPVKCVSRTRKDILRFTYFLVGALRLVSTHINVIYFMRFR